MPGSLFLRVARLVFPDDTVTRVFLPAVADFHDELNAAGQGALARWRVRCRWYVALASLVVVSPVAIPSPGALLALVTVILYIGAWQFFGWFMAGTATAGIALAVALRVWNTRHPSVLRDPSQADPAAPEINLSAIHVGGDIAGLMFAVGSVIVVFLGIPQLWWYYAGVMVVSALVAWLRFMLLRFSGVTNTSILRG
ncbi:MAG: hypothetical protein AB7P99_08535 [Vicinamibacterales bacterium]